MSKSRLPTRFSLNVPNLVMGMVVGGFIVSIGFTIYLGIRAGNDPVNDSPRINAPSSGGKDSNLSQQISLPQGHEPSIVDSIADILALYPREFDRNLALYINVGQAEAKVIQELLIDAAVLEVGKDEADWREHALQVMMSKLVVLDANAAIEILNQFDLRDQQALVYTVAKSWSTINLEAALKYVSELNLSLKRHAVRGIAEAKLDSSRSELVDLGRRIGTENLVQEVIQAIVYRSDSDNPEEAWETVSRMVSQMTIANFDRIQNIANAWVQESGVEVLNVMLVDIVDPDLRRMLLLSTLRQVSRESPQSAFDFAMRLTENDRADFLNTVMYTWSRNDPEEAKKVLEQMDDDSVRRQLEQTLIRGWASTDPKSLFDAAEEFPAEFHDQARLQAIRAIAVSSPTEAISFLSQIEGDYAVSAAIESIAQSWAKVDSDAALNWFFSYEESVFNDPMATLRFLREVSEIDPRKAFDTALSLNADMSIPLTDGQISLESLLLMNLVDQDLDLVIELVPRIRNDVSKFELLKQVGYQLARESRHLQALRLGQQLAEEFQDRYYFSWGTNSWSTGDAGDILSLFQQLPSNSARSKAAFGVRLQDRFFDKLSDQQLSIVNAYMTESDLVELEELLESK